MFLGGAIMGIRGPFGVHQWGLFGDVKGIFGGHFIDNLNLFEENARQIPFKHF